VIIDQVTGLWWQHPTRTPNNLNQTCNPGCSQPDAIQYCANLTLGGHCDWRLPTRIELVSIVDVTQHSPAINDVFAGTIADVYWTASASTVVGGGFWEVYFVDGLTGTHLGTELDQVRCVR
jgi:hypothetical protein